MRITSEQCTGLGPIRPIATNTMNPPLEATG